MAKIVNNYKGFKVIRLSRKEAYSLSWGDICESCNSIITEDMYYIAAINDVLCKSCYNNFINESTRYSEDIPIEDRNFNYYKEALGL